MICEGNALADPRNGDRLLTVVPSSPRIRTCRSGRVPKQGFTELEPTDDGKYIVTSSWIQHIRQAFLDGDLDPLLELVAIHGQYGDPEPAAHQRSIFHGNLLFSPHLAALLTDVLTGKNQAAERTGCEENPPEPCRHHGRRPGDRPTESAEPDRFRDVAHGCHRNSRRRVPSDRGPGGA